MCGALSSALSAMVGNLTYGKTKYRKRWDRVEEISVESQNLKDAFVRAVDEDTDAFNKLFACFRMPKNTKEEEEAKDKAIQEATKGATLVPLGVLEKSVRSAELALEIAEIGNPNSLSDAGVAGLTARTAAIGAYYNVLINLESITDKEFSRMTSDKAEELKAKAIEITDKVQEDVTARLKEALNNK
jgi:glutamate formiminotransferase/formiminotetrahydrofolate cyclodeaminase